VGAGAAVAAADKRTPLAVILLQGTNR
jgi:hypothetical protein